MKTIFLLYSLFGVLFAQSYPQWGSWWQQPIPHEYGGQAPYPGQPVPAEDQLQQREVDREIQQNDVEDELQQRGTDYRLQQNYEDDVLQQRREDEVLQQGTGVSP